MTRQETFVRWFGRSLEIEDCDSALFMTNYFFDRFEYNKEQRLWLAWLYGNTYYWPTSYVIWNEFPDMHLVGVERLKEWNNENYKRLRYQTDTKWNKGHLADQFMSYKNWVGDRSQREALTAGFTEDKVSNFYTLWDEVNSWHKFGRYTSWFYMQTLKQCCDVPIEVDGLWFHDQSGSRSHRNGMCYAVGKDHWVDLKLDKSCVAQLEEEAKELLEETRRQYPHVADKADFFAMETALCSFKKLFRKSRGRYLGYYIDRQAEEIMKVEQDDWWGIDWTPMWDARKETLENKWLNNKIEKYKMELYLDTGDFEESSSGHGLEGFM
jgi:hypothetical protein